MQIKNRVIFIIIIIFSIVNIYYKYTIKNKLVGIYKGEKCSYKTYNYTTLSINDNGSFIFEGEDKKKQLIGKVSNGFFKHNHIIFYGKTEIQATFSGNSFLIESINKNLKDYNESLCGGYY